MKNNLIKRCCIIGCMLFFLHSIFAQSIPIQGKVLSEVDNQPIAGVSIIEKGTTNGTASDIDGNFSLNVNSNSTLVIICRICYN